MSLLVTVLLGCIWDPYYGPCTEWGWYHSDLFRWHPLWKNAYKM